MLAVTAYLTQWVRVTYICADNLTIIGSDNCLSPGWCQAIIWTNAGILKIEPLKTNSSEISIKILTFSLKKMYLKMSAKKWRPSCLALNVLKHGSRSRGNYLMIWNICIDFYWYPILTSQQKRELIHFLWYIHVPGMKILEICILTADITPVWLMVSVSEIHSFNPLWLRDVTWCWKS